MADDQLSPETIEYLDGRPKSERSPLGQFITPRALREKLASKIEFGPGMRVLDPGVGTAEFLKTCHEIEPKLDLVGWDIDPLVLKVAKKVAPFAEFKKQSALEQPWREDFDVVIGNPPYFEVRNLDPQLKARYKAVLGGRPNIFSLFFAAGLGALKPGGTLGFVVPPSMNNGAFFEKLRKFILSQGSIDFLEIYSDHSLFLEKPRLIESEFENKSTLWHLGYESITGALVWNANKEKLKATPEKGTVPLLWAHNITHSKEIVINEEKEKKPQYVATDEVLTGPAIIVNRITGSVGSGNLRCALVPAGYKFVGENHVNIIRARKNVKQKVSWDELLDLLRLPGVNSRIQKLTGNTQISCVELTNWLPLDTDVAATQDQEVVEDLKLFHL